MLLCEECGSSFAQVARSNGIRLDLRGRKRCLVCRPHRPLRAPRKPVHRAIQTRTCAQCGAHFPAKAVVGNSVRSLYRRRFCLSCSPFGAHNTSRLPPGALAPDELIEHRRKRRNAKTYRYQKKKRVELKTELIAERGGRCEECGYNAAAAALEFHHRDAVSKEFQISYGSVSRIRLWAEAAKCDLLCANCHRLRHLSGPKDGERNSVELRRERKRRAVVMLGAAHVGAADSNSRPACSSSIIWMRARRTLHFRRWHPPVMEEDRGRAREMRPALRKLPPRDACRTAVGRRRPDDRGGTW
jgi:hypothetical protein